MKKLLNIAFIFFLFSGGVLALVYAGIIFYTAVTTSPMPYCDEIDTSKPRPVGMRYYCKGREKKPIILKPRGFIRNGIFLEFGQ